MSLSMKAPVIRKFQLMHECRFNPFNASCSKLLLFEGPSAILV